jgi:hypothetical protein
MGDIFLVIVLQLSLKSWITNSIKHLAVPKRPRAGENLGEQIKKTKALCPNAIRAREILENKSRNPKRCT